ncbi:prepilin-type N-terminal cleavage/methylation domain-containing protein [Gemmata sp. JC673]|uniref:Prepilin-type N-terminal cleavage/methylation domain-containing protein n=1 Tax=Gemmata algarum TaxID=2975278 RepID=A0ABU5EX31_9BACT|nr:prepilin-type N-terminal cleavage/methylation domain-containing protein [Gemmata algarum]MDY3559493.1 prepilin-type N-terminal cleavage/methylation domain-containing protein [Gemmata algarum]
MIRTQNARRSGFTLVELLVGISIFLALAGLVLLLYPGARDQDRVRYAVSDITAQLRMAQSMAARDKAPRGVRFVLSNDATNDDKTDARWVTEMQYVEQPPPLIPTTTPLKFPRASNPNLGTAPELIENLAPRVRFDYGFVSSGMNSGAINGRRCFIENLKSEEADLIQPGCTIVMPTFNSWNKIALPSISVPTTVKKTGPNAKDLYTVEAVLEVYPDAVMGGSTQAVVYNFAIYLLAVPLVGEPIIPLPKKICVDLNVSVPDRVNATTDLDVIFGPDGKLLGGSGGQLFLWVRDYTKPAVYTITPPTPSTPRSATYKTGQDLVDALQKGGEQHVIAIRSSGTIAHNNIAWPGNGTSYTSGGEPFKLVRDRGQ